MNKIFSTVTVLFLIIALGAAVGLGVWAGQLNTNLSAAQKQLTQTQADLKKAQADNAQLTANLTQAQATLDQTKSALATAQSNLTTANSDKATMQSKMDKAKTLTDIADAMYSSPLNASQAMIIDDKIKAAGDSQLISLWNAVVASGSDKNLYDFNKYLFATVAEALKQP